MRVQVYKNLRTGLWSVCEMKSANTRGRLIASESSVTLTDCRFVVREAQRQYVLRKQERAVHAWVEGEWTPAHARSVAENRPSCAREFSYNPYRVGHFHVAGDIRARVDSAARAWFTADGKAYFSNERAR